MAIDLKLIDKLLADYKKPEDIIGENGLLKQLTKAVLERAMQAEMTEHLGYEKHDPAGHNSGNSRNSTPWTFTDPYQIVVSPADANTITVATGTTTSTPYLYYTHNGGTTWHKAKGLPQQVSRNNTIYYPTHRFYATFEPGVAGTILLTDHDPSTDNVLIYKSTDNAKTFSLVKTFVQPVPPRPWPFLLFPNSHERIARHIPYYATRFFANRIAFNPQAPTRVTPAVVLTTRFGAYVSYDVGSTWKRIDKKAIAHHFIGVDWNSGYVFLSSFGQGVIRSNTPLQ